MNTDIFQADLTIETASGNLVNPMYPDPDTIDIKDIGWALSRIPRFAGHTITEIPFNVAQHSIYVAELMERFLNSTLSFEDVSSIDLKTANDMKFELDHTVASHEDFLLKCLLHDAHEAYTGDIPSPIKRIPELTPTIKMIESNLDKAISVKFDLQPYTQMEQKYIKFGDKLAQAIESYQFMPSRGLNWDLPKPSLAMIQQFPTPMTPLESYKKFIKTFDLYKDQ